jgi:hypothetical protein
MTPCIWLNILGGVLEISGFLLVAVELFRTQRREFGTPKAAKLLIRSERSLVRSLRRLTLFRRPHEAAKELESKPAYLTGLTAAGRSNTSMELTAGPPTLEKRVWKLENELQKLSSQIAADRKKAMGDLDRLRDAQSKRLTSLEQTREEREERQREFLHTSVMLQWWGIGLFVCGTVASVLSNVISCG